MATDFTESFRPLIGQNYRTVNDRAQRTIAGLSMEGAQTLNVAFAHLDDDAYVGIGDEIDDLPRSRVAVGDERRPSDQAEPDLLTTQEVRCPLQTVAEFSGQRLGRAALRSTYGRPDSDQRSTAPRAISAPRSSAAPTAR